MKSKGVTTQMKALDEYFLMVVFMLLQNRGILCLIWTENMEVKGLKCKIHNSVPFVYNTGSRGALLI